MPILLNEGELHLSIYSRRDFIVGALATGAYIVHARANQAPNLGQPKPGSWIEPGDRAGGETSDTHVLQRAIDEAQRRGGGTVHILPGRYVSGSLRLHSHVSLWLEAGATLVMSTDAAEFFPADKLSYDPKSNKATSDFQVALLVGDSIENVSILGEGTIDCERTKGGGPKPIALRRCSHVDIRGITIRNAPNYNISMLGCDFVTIDGVTIQNGHSDGIDPDCSRYVRISNCYVESVDDAIVLKSSGALGERRDTEYVTVENCILRTASIHFKCGTESCGDFRNIIVSNCVFQGGMGMRHGNPGIALYAVDGGALENVAFSNIVMHDVGTPLAIVRGDRDRCSLGTGAGALQSVQIMNVVASGARLASVISGLPSSSIAGIAIDGLTVTMANSGAGPKTLQEIPEKPKDYPQPTMFGPLPAFGLFLRHATDIALRNVQFKSASSEERPAVVADDVAALQLLGYRSHSATAPQLWLNNVRDSIVESIDVLPLAIHSCRVSGAKTNNLLLKGSAFMKRSRSVALDADVPQHAVHTPQG
jgi:hypothetical protein